MSILGRFRRTVPQRPEMGIPELRLRLGLLDRIIKEAQNDGDTRWENLIPQQEELNEKLVTKLKEERRVKGIPESKPVVIRLQQLRLFGIRKEARNG